MANKLSIRFLGHSAFEISSNGYRILIDPFLSGNPKAAVSPAEVNPTHIIVSHGHGDHLGDTEAIASRTGCTVIAVHEVAEFLGRRGIETWGMGAGGGHQFDFGRVDFTLAHHSSSLPDGSYAGNPVGIVLRLGERTIYHAGDTALFLDMKLIGERFDLDVALLPIGDNYTMGVDDAVRAVEMLRPKLTIPMHYNTFPPIAADPHRFVEKLAAIGARGHVLQPGEVCEE
jgi:L-ascorbate metabolism protein UlaG (beta-lactamase superfamily)